MKAFRLITILLLGCNFIHFSAHGQDLDVRGKLKVGTAEEAAIADSMVVRLPDGTLAVKSINSVLTSFYEADKLTASDGGTFDRFGHSVSISGDYAIIGAYSDDDKGTDAGAAYIFFRAGDLWSQQTKLTAMDGEAGDFFGLSVSINGDYAIIGARSDDDNGDAAGAAYIFSRSGTTWTQQAKITASDGEAEDLFGSSVGISGDYAIAGAFWDDDKGNNAGAAYIFVRSGNAWNQQAKITALDGSVGDEFGRSVSISGDYAILGAEQDDDEGFNAGAAYIFSRSGSTWTQQAKLTALDGEADDFFGQRVSINGDYAVVGVQRENEKGTLAGAAYMYARSGNTWIQQAKITAADGEGGDLFGRSVNVNGDKVIVGAIGDDDKGSSAGAAYIFSRFGNSWNQETKITAADGEASDSFGQSVSINGVHAIVGTSQDDDKGESAGAVYTFQAGLNGDGNSSNELQLLTQSGSTVSLSMGGGSVSIEDGDASSTNEIQTLTRSGSNIFLSANGGSVSINDADSDPNNERDNLGNHTATTNLNMGGNNIQLANSNIIGVNQLTFNDPGTNEGIRWNGSGFPNVEIYAERVDDLIFPNQPHYLHITTSAAITGSQGVSASGAGTSMYKQLEIRHPASTTYKWFIGHQQENPSTSDDDLYFYVERGSTLSNAKVAGYVQDNGSGGQMNFTGQHRSLVDGINFNELSSETEDYTGLIVVADKNEYLSMSGGLKSGKDAIMIDESLPVVSVSTQMKDKRVFGVISSVEPEKRHDAAGAFATPYHKEDGDQRMYINATGEGAIWVIDQGGAIESGDYIQSSGVPGYGMRQDDDLLHNYTVAKLTMDVNFEPRLVAKKQIKKTEQSVNVLDEYGKIIWETIVDEDNQPVLEYEYKIRYLLPDGTQIDKRTYEQMKCEEKEVYRAAFVGCTYHCG